MHLLFFVGVFSEVVVLMNTSEHEFVNTYCLIPVPAQRVQDGNSSDVDLEDGPDAEGHT